MSILPHITSLTFLFLHTTFTVLRHKFCACRQSWESLITFITLEQIFKLHSQLEHCTKWWKLLTEIIRKISNRTLLLFIGGIYFIFTLTYFLYVDFCIIRKDCQWGYRVSWWRIRWFQKTVENVIEEFLMKSF